jgi:hypothetical protein
MREAKGLEVVFKVVIFLVMLERGLGCQDQRTNRETIYTPVSY